MAVIEASILDANYAELRHEVVRVAEAGVDAFHLDVMDGQLTPRLTFGEYVVAQVRNWIEVPIEVHLAVLQPERLAQRVCDAGADLVVFHIEATDRHHEVVDIVRAAGRSTGIALRHDTPVSDLSDDLLLSVDWVALVAVPLGYGGHSAAPDTCARIAEVRRRCSALGHNVSIEVDGGVKPDNAFQFVDGGADAVTVGTGIYHATDVTAAVSALREVGTPEHDALARRRARRFLAAPSLDPVDDTARRRRLDDLRDALDIPRNIWDPLTSAH